MWSYWGARSGRSPRLPCSRGAISGCSCSGRGREHRPIASSSICSSAAHSPCWRPPHRPGAVCCTSWHRVPRFRRRAQPLDPMFAVLSPGRRLEVPPDMELFGREVDREFPEVRQLVDELYSNFALVNAAADAAFERDLGLASGHFLGAAGNAPGRGHAPVPRSRRPPGPARQVSSGSRLSRPGHGAGRLRHRSRGARPPAAGLRPGSAARCLDARRVRTRGRRGRARGVSDRKGGGARRSVSPGTPGHRDRRPARCRRRDRGRRRGGTHRRQRGRVGPARRALGRAIPADKASARARARTGHASPPEPDGSWSA